MQAFDFPQVRLLPGMIKNSVNEMAAFYRAIPNDDILKYMREAAGLPAPGNNLTGWYAHSHGMGTLGQWVSAYCRLFALTGNEADRKKAIELIENFWLCHDLTRDSERPLLGVRSFYAFEKLVRALCDLQVYAAYPTRDRVVQLVDFALEKLDRSNKFGDNGTEWYTMPESLYEAAILFDLPSAAEAAAVWEYRDFWDLFNDGRDPFTRKPEAGLYSDYNMYGACKFNRQDNWTCCTGTRPLLVIDMVRQIYYHDDTSLFISQYTASEVTWVKGGQTVRLVQETAFPLEDTTRLTLHLDQPLNFTLSLRQPPWLAGPMTVAINGKQDHDAVNDKGWLPISKTWQPGDASNKSRENTETAFYYQDLVLMGKIAELLGKPEDAVRYRTQAQAVCENYNAYLLVKDPENGNWCYRSYDVPDRLVIRQVNQAIPLSFGMVPADKKDSVIRSFIRAAETGVLNSGEIGLRFLFNTLHSLGCQDIIHQMILQEEHPSYARFVRRGETTLPEYWADRGRSRNHDMMGQIVEWFYSGLLGLSSEDGFSTIQIAPVLPQALDWVEGQYHAITGLIRIRFEQTDQLDQLTVEIPDNTHARLVLPRQTTTGYDRVFCNGTPLADPNRPLEVGGGRYAVSGSLRQSES